MRLHRRVARASDTFCREMLPRVSRTFALNIPVLPPPLDVAVTVAYLLLRMADTVEDEAVVPAEARARLLGELASLATLPEGWSEASAAFSARATRALRPACPPAERESLEGLPLVLHSLADLPAPVARRIAVCVRQMCDGMAKVGLASEASARPGLEDLGQTLEYCYYVAGTVGEMLTDLFAWHSPGVSARRASLAARAVSFGRGLQLVNILKDVRADLDRGSCWLPRTTLAAHGLTPEILLDPARRDDALAALDELHAVARAELSEALEYVLAIPRRERALRLFCLWPLFLAVLTLRKLQNNPAVLGPTPVKIRRRAVSGVIAVTSALSAHDRGLRLLFDSLTLGLPAPRAVRAASFSPADDALTAGLNG